MISLSRLFRRLHGNHPGSKRVYVFLGNAEKQSFIFEMTGSPGVGKSTLLNHMMDSQFIRKVGLTGLSSDRFGDHDEIRMAYDRVLKHTLNTFEKKQDIEKHSRRAAVSLALHRQMRSTEKPAILIVEEGLFHHFKHSLIGIYASDKPSFDIMMERRAIIHLTARPEAIAERVIKRHEETGKLLPYHANKDFRQICDYCQDSQASRENALKFFKSVGVPVLTISAENSPNEMASQITAFIHETLSSRQAIV